MRRSGLAILCLTAATWAANPPMTKLEYYNRVIAPRKGRAPLARLFGYEDRKRSVFDVGNLRVRFSNAAILGYDRWGWNHEFPQGSMDLFGCCTYYWTLSPIIGALVNGLPSVSVGVRGSVRDHEEEFEPLPGYDAGYEDEETNVGIAFNDKSASWPAAWPIETDPTGTYRDPVTLQNFPGIERPLDRDHPSGKGLRFPGVLDGQAVATREAYFVTTENDPLEGNTIESNGVGPLNVRVDMWGLQYSDVLNQDFIIWAEKFTNVGTDTLREVFVGIAGDPDTPEQGGSEWIDDYSYLIEPGDPLIAEKAIDTTNADLLQNLAVIWDGNDQVEGFISSGVGWIGLKALKTPYTQSADGADNDSDGLTDEGFDGVDNDGDDEIDETDEGEEIGLTGYFAFPYDYDAQSDNEAYYTQIRAGYGKDNTLTGYSVTPHPLDIFQKPYSYGPDVTIVMTSGPFTLAPGQSVDFVFADIMGASELDLLNNAKTAQRLFNAGFLAAAPPDEPVVHGIAGDGSVTLYWDPFPSETSVDPNTGNNAFQGYRVYRSDDQGATWGDPITDGKGIATFFKPLAIYDKIDNISGLYPYGSPELYYDLGGNSGLQYTFTDNTVLNGVEYWYAVAAYDAPDGIVPPLENPPKKARSDADTPGNNTVILIPQQRPVGWTDGTVELEHAEGTSTADVGYSLLDPAELEGYTYKMTVAEDRDTVNDTTKSYSVLNTNRFTTATQIALTGTRLPHRNVLADSVMVYGPTGTLFLLGTDYTVEEKEGKLVAVEGGGLASGTTYTVTYLYHPILESALFATEGYNSNFEGIRLTVSDVDAVALDAARSGWNSASASDWTLALAPFSNVRNKDDYRIIFSDSTALQSPAGKYVPIQAWNVSDSLRFEKVIVSPPIPSTAEITIETLNGRSIILKEIPNGATSNALTWKITLSSPPPAALSEDFRATAICDSLLGNGVYDTGELFTDLDSDSAYTAGEPFEDCGFDTASAVAGLTGAVSDTLASFVESLACAAPDTIFDTTYTVVLWPTYNTTTFVFDTTQALKIVLTAGIACDTSNAPQEGDTVEVRTSKPLTAEDVYLLRTSISAAAVTSTKQLEQIAVVPNPYKAASAYETSIESKEVQFHYLPEECTIRIFTISGELVRVLSHRPESPGWRGAGIEAWNLRTYNDQEVAYGVYLFHVEAEGSGRIFEKTGKFAIIR